MDAEITNSLIAQLIRIADALEKMAAGSGPVAPDYQRPLEDYSNFDWASIGATEVRADKQGATHVEWGGMLWLRRSNDDKRFTPAIWYSRSGGKNEAGETLYLRLITFKQISEAEPLPTRVANQTEKKPGAPIPSVSNGQRQAVPAQSPARKLITYQDYYAQASAKPFGFPLQEARKIATAAGIDVDHATANTNFLPAFVALSFFAEACHKFELNMPEALKYFEKNQSDTEKALNDLHARFEPTN